MDPRIDTLADAYRRIAARKMRGLAVCNDRLEVEPVGFRPWEGGTLGILIAPWFMNLVILPGPGAADGALSNGESIEVDLPAGRYQFHAGEVAGLLHLSAPLFSSVADFPDQQTARAIAQEILARLFDDSPELRRESPVRGVGDVLFADSMSRRSLLRRAMLLPDQET